MWPRVRSPWRPCLGWIRCLCRGDELHTEGGVPWALGPCSLRSADGLVIIISTPLSYLTTSPCASWTAGSLASLQCAIFLLVLYFAHNINLYRDPAPGFIHLCLTSGDISHWGFCFFSSSSSSSAESKLLIFFFLSHWVLCRYCRKGSDTIFVIQCRKVLRRAGFWWRDSKEGHLRRADLSRAEVMFAVTAVLWL